MGHLDVASFLGTLALALATAKVFGLLARRFGQPAVLGELVAGVVLGSSVLGLIQPEAESIQAMAELGIVILLFAIGLETDLRSLARVGVASVAVAVVGVVLPFLLGLGVCELMGLGRMEAIVTGAALTATSVGITARVLSDLGQLQAPEGQIVLGAAVLDDVIGLMILTIVAGLTHGESVTFIGAALTGGAALGFLGATLLLGSLTIPRLFRADGRAAAAEHATILGLLLALGLAWLAERAGSAPMIGAFTAGLLIARTSAVHQVEHGVTALGHFFVPLFFVSVGAAVDIRVFNPASAMGPRVLSIGGLLVAVALAGKFLAGYAPFWFQGRKSVIGAGMIPRGEVGLIFAQMGLASGVLDAGLFGAITLMVVVTTFVTPPLLKFLLRSSPHGPPGEESEGIESLVIDA
jgi:Kef-type K+ transport system membrane component KefB